MFLNTILAFILKLYNDDITLAQIVANKIPSKYVIEMICDWIGAGKVYSKEKWTQAEPLNYYNKVRKGRYFHEETEKLIVYFLEVIRDKGLDEFHRLCRKGCPALTNYSNPKGVKYDN